MACAVEMYFDAEADDVVRRTWRDLADAGVASSMLVPGFRPHVSLGVCETLDVPGFAHWLAQYARVISPVRFTLSTIGSFPGGEGVIFFGATVTRKLLDMHLAFDQIFGEYGGQLWDHYRVDAWVPHCTLGLNLTDSQLAAALPICRRTSLPIQVQVMEIGIVDVSSTHCRELAACPLV